MTVSELIASLANFPPTARVVVDGYEGGLEDVISIAGTEIRADANSDADYYGSHLIDSVSLNQSVVWIKGVNVRGDKLTVQDMERIKKQGLW